MRGSLLGHCSVSSCYWPVPGQEGSPGSVPQAESVRMCLATQMRLPRTLIFTDFWEVAEGLIVWPRQWQKGTFMIQRKPTWGASTWRETANLHMLVMVIRACTHTHTHIGRHQKHYNYTADPYPKDMYVSRPHTNDFPEYQTLPQTRLFLPRCRTH